MRWNSPFSLTYLDHLPVKSVTRYASVIPSLGLLPFCLVFQFAFSRVNVFGRGRVRYRQYFDCDVSV